MTTRAKFTCTSIEGEDTKTIYLSPVVTGSEENETFFKYTPGGSISLSVVNPEVVFEQDKQYYVDFTQAN